MKIVTIFDFILAFHFTNKWQSSNSKQCFNAATSIVIIGNQKDTSFFCVRLSDSTRTGRCCVAVERHFKCVAVRPLIQNSTERPEITGVSNICLYRTLMCWDILNAIIVIFSLSVFSVTHLLNSLHDHHRQHDNQNAGHTLAKQVLFSWRLYVSVCLLYRNC